MNDSSSIPALSLDEAAAVAGRVFGQSGSVSALPSDRDQNFLVQAGEDRALVLKVANASDDLALLTAQVNALRHVHRSNSLVPAVIPALDGQPLYQIEGRAGARHWCWAIARLDGRPMAAQRWRSAELHRDLGKRTAELALSLATFDDPAAHRVLVWDLAQGAATIRERLHLVHDPSLREVIASTLAAYESNPVAFSSLPHSVIHGDLNDHNILVVHDADPFKRGQSISGIIDFGDMVYSATVCDLAIVAAYAMLDARDPLGVLRAIVSAYNVDRTLSSDELAILFDLVRMRLAVSACMAAQQTAARPSEAYLAVSQSGVQALLPKLAQMSASLVAAQLRAACGHPAVASAPAVARYLAQAARKDVLQLPEPKRLTLVDLSISSSLLSAEADENVEHRLTPRVEEHLQAEGANVGVGRYMEARLLYTAPAFTHADPAIESRTIHLGVDLFAAAGTPVHAPLDGVVEGYHDNASSLDYGPVIILRHETDEGVPFFTLYGHLARRSLTALNVGDRITAGQHFAWLGTAEENVHWTPHLHFQIMLDLFGLGTEFPGVGRASDQEFWEQVSPDPSGLLAIPSTCGRRPDGKARTADARKHHFGGNLSLAYRNPVKAVRGWKQWLFDESARRYLDAYNNVPHVGHAHPRVVEAVSQQFALLSTNTRYLSDLHSDYACALIATLPQPLEVCWLVSSASEANELALRLARAYTRQRDMLVLEAAYHGNTTTLVDISPYKHLGPGGLGTPDWAHVMPLPDDYRGVVRRGATDIGSQYAAFVRRALHDLQAKGRRPCAFIAETCPSVGGQIFLPSGYLAEVYTAVRNAGGVAIADEVQTGLGRIGTHFWAFEAHDVVPDIVVMGKPLGNGFPLAAVVTTRAIADAFDNGMEYFSTFGGNQAACAAGLAVLDVVRDEGLQQHARDVGNAMLAAMRPWVDRYPIVGDVRGSGLFLGVELVRDRQTLEPADREASYIANRMREEGILLGTDGPYHNVVKIRPPMPFNMNDAERVVETMERILKAELH